MELKNRKQLSILDITSECTENDLNDIIGQINCYYWEDVVRLLAYGFCPNICINYNDKIVDYYGILYQLTDSQFNELMNSLITLFDSEKERVGVDYCEYTATEIMYYKESRIEYLDW